ncbi:DUF1573 domain-containing protein [Paraflavitalea sp. CAU 1676]|uniref:DUF1573 domain-containing protein n=1 Tax=Paraflavitalea sp. CAU 1676 TaxID=3032598 RepID=UPI0023DC48EE|nr:DUF1573 domain-containing protein [Paraflavitalea sp. CAU 1676]MDF2189706.1 DUF1573 domain-containing protein [Paraflavitalea sp. CAU 1676]
MKKWLTFILIAGLATAAKAQTAPDNSSPAADVLSLKQSSYDFGKIPQARPVTHVFEVKNTGKEVMRLDNVQASCGCTTPEWSREPIQPGATTTIKVGYNAALEGQFNKTVTIVYNNNQTKTIVISGTVYKAPTTSAPENASLTLLKH